MRRLRERRGLMWRIISTAVAFVMPLSTGYLLQAADRPAKPLQRVLFGSCIKENKPVPIYQTIVAHRPDLFVLLVYNIDADTEDIYADTDDIDVMRAKYARLRSTPEFSQLLKTCPVLAIWDDHNYGSHDAGADYPKRIESQKVCVDFWGDAADSVR